MFAHKTVLILLAFVLFVNALPLRHGRRGACRPHSAIVVPSAIPSANVNAGGKPEPVITGDDEPTTTVKSQPTTVKDEPTIEPSSEPTKAPTSSVKPTKSQEEEEPAEPTTKPPSSGGSGNSKLSSLFPVPGFSKSWSTSPLAENPLPLSDGTLRPTKLLAALSHDFVSAPDGKKAMKAHFPKGSYTFTHQPQGGLSFYAPGPSSVDLSTAKEATFGYSVYFDAGFAFNKGGKLPGICKYPRYQSYTHEQHIYDCGIF